jgi:hypothetical protein
MDEAMPLHPVFHAWDEWSSAFALYRMYYEDWMPEAAWAKMLRYGFHVRLTLRGLDPSFWRHTNKPG